jgi:hypothetical protein
MSAKDRALRKFSSFKDLEAKFQSNVANRIEREHYWLLKSVGESVPADINDLWEYANEQLKHLDPKQTLDGVLVGEYEPQVQELFEARRGIYLAQLELFKLWDQPVRVESKIKEIQSQLVQHYLNINSSRNTNN